MQEQVYTFSEEGMRKLVEMYRNQQREISSLRRNLAHFSTRRHQTVYLPPGGKAKLVRFTHLPAAYGGARRGILGSAASANGNLNPANLKYYPKYVAVYDVNDDGDIEETDENIWAANLGSLPLTEGWGLAHKWTDDPVFGEVWAVNTDMSTTHHGSACYEWYTSSESGGVWTFAEGGSKLIRGATGLGLANGETTAWSHCHAGGSSDGVGDIMLTHVGRWEVTIGFQGALASTAYNTITTSAASAGTAHTHTVQSLTPGYFMFGLYRNFQPGVSVVGTPDNAKYIMDAVPLPNSYSIDGAFQSVTAERVFYIESDPEPWHGQHYTRLTLFGKFGMHTYSNNGGSSPTFAMKKCWLHVKPAMGCRESVNQGPDDFMGAGSNQYPLNDYTNAGNGTGTFRWYSGGSAPVGINANGTAV